MVLPFALSIHTFINNVGAYVGFASIIGLALLVLLNFAQARETSSLRSRLEEAGERIAMLENRLTQALRGARPGVPGHRPSRRRRWPRSAPPAALPARSPGVAPAVAVGAFRAWRPDGGGCALARLGDEAGHDGCDTRASADDDQGAGRGSGGRSRACRGRSARGVGGCGGGRAGGTFCERGVGVPTTLCSSRR